MATSGGSEFRACKSKLKQHRMPTPTHKGHVSNRENTTTPLSHTNGDAYMKMVTRPNRMATSAMRAPNAKPFKFRRHASGTLKRHARTMYLCIGELVQCRHTRTERCVYTSEHDGDCRTRARPHNVLAPSPALQDARLGRNGISQVFTDENDVRCAKPDLCNHTTRTATTATTTITTYDNNNNTRQQQHQGSGHQWRDRAANVNTREAHL